MIRNLWRRVVRWFAAETDAAPDLVRMERWPTTSHACAIPNPEERDEPPVVKGTGTL